MHKTTASSGINKTGAPQPFPQQDREKLPWRLANIVPVRKKNRQVRVCVDFRDLNAACPKDDFPLPITELMIDVFDKKCHLWYKFVICNNFKFITNITNVIRIHTFCFTTINTYYNY